MAVTRANSEIRNRATTLFGRVDVEKRAPFAAKDAILGARVSISIARRLDTSSSPRRAVTLRACHPSWNLTGTLNAPSALTATEVVSRCATTVTASPLVVPVTTTVLSFANERTAGDFTASDRPAGEDVDSSAFAVPGTMRVAITSDDNRILIRSILTSFRIKATKNPPSESRPMGDSLVDSSAAIAPRLPGP